MLDTTEQLSIANKLHVVREALRGVLHGKYYKSAAAVVYYYYYSFLQG